MSPIFSVYLLLSLFLFRIALFGGRYSTDWLIVCETDRGEGFNHALMDVHKLLRAIDSLTTTNTPSCRSDILSEYEDEVRSRGRKAALMCREACLEVHAFDTLGDHSVVRQKAFD